MWTRRCGWVARGALTWMIAVALLAVAPVTGGAAGVSEVRDADPSVPALGRAWPVGHRPVVLRGFDPPVNPYGPGHRGVDLAAAPGAAVRAVAAGRVVFAGQVGGRGVVSVRLAGTGLRTTYEPVDAEVGEGDEVSAGAAVGTVSGAGRSHCAVTCLHWGLLRDDVYLDPLALLPPWLLDHGPSRLLPVLGVPLP